MSLKPSTPLLPLPPQVQAAIKKKMEKQKKRASGQGEGLGIPSATPQPPRHQRPGPALQASAAVPEDRESLEETLEEMMDGPQRREREMEEVEPVDLLPIVDSVFGQVGGKCCCVRVCVCDLMCAHCYYHCICKTVYQHSATQ